MRKRNIENSNIRIYNHYAWGRRAMSLMIKSNGRKKLPFFDGIGDDIRITFTDAQKIGDMLAAKSNGDKHAGFSPWLNWNLPFTDRLEPVKEIPGDVIPKTETISALNDAYKVLNFSENNIPVEQAKIDVKHIEPNPYWNIRDKRLLMSRIKFWAIVIEKADVDNYPHCIMAVRAHKGKYQAVIHHHQLVALRLLQVKTVAAPLLHLTDDQMKKRLAFERF